MSTYPAATTVANQIPLLASTATVLYATRAMEMGVPRREAYRRARKLERDGKLTKRGFVKKGSKSKHREPFRRRAY